MFCAYFTSEPVYNSADAMKSDRERFKKFFHAMLTDGIYLAPSQFEAGFISTAHTMADIDQDSCGSGESVARVVTFSGSPRLTLYPAAQKKARWKKQ